MPSHCAYNLPLACSYAIKKKDELERVAKANR
jgi:ribosomal protein S7